MSKFFKVDSCNECPYHEQLWCGEYAKPERTYFCAYSPIQFLIPNEGKYEIHPDCGLLDIIYLGLTPGEIEIAIKGYA
jgi:hypothetical protein